MGSIFPIRAGRNKVEWVIALIYDVEQDEDLVDRPVELLLEFAVRHPVVSVDGPCRCTPVGPDQHMALEVIVGLGVPARA